MAKTTNPSSSALGMFTPVEQTREFARVLLWGREGSTKTTGAATLANLGRVALINAESGIKVRALQANGVNTANLMVWPAIGEKITYEALDAVYRQIQADLARDPGSWAGVVFDSATEIAQALIDSVSDERIERARSRGAQITTSQAFNTEIGDYGTMTKMFLDLLRKFRDLPCHFVVTALERRDVDNDTSQVTYGPAVSPGVQTSLLGYVDEVLYMRAPDSERPYARAICRNSGRYRTKDRSGMLPDVLVRPTVERIIGYIDGTLHESTDPEQQPLRDDKTSAPAKDA